MATRRAISSIQFQTDDSEPIRLEKLRRLSEAVLDLARDRAEAAAVPVTPPSGGSTFPDFTGPAFLGRVSGTGQPTAMTPATSLTLLDIFTATTKGLAPAPGAANASLFLNAAGAWTVPSSIAGSYAAPSVQVGLTAIPGTALTGIRSDAAPALSQAIAPTWTGQHVWTLPLQGPDGTAALPTFTFPTDPNTGVYRVGADNLGIAAGGVLLWDINSTRARQTVPFDIDVGTSGVTPNDINAFRIRNLASNNGGFRFRTFDALGPAFNDAGNELGIWEEDGTNGLSATSIGFRWLHAGDIDGSGDLIFYSHYLSAAGQEIYRHVRDTAQMLFAGGTVAAPTIAFSGNVGTGMYSGTVGTLRLAAGGVQVLGATSTSFNPTQPVRGLDGSAAIPTYSFVSDTNTGITWIAADNFGFYTNGTLRFDISTTRNTWTLPHGGAAGSAGTPTWSFSGDTNTGVYSVGADDIGVSTNGVLRWNVNTTNVVSTLALLSPVGSAALPSYSFSGDTNTGVYNIGADNLGLSTNGTLRVDLNTARLLVNLPIQATNATTGVNVVSTSPRILFDDTDRTSPVNQRLIDIVYDGGTFSMRTRTDADGAGQTFFSAVQSAVNTLPAQVNIRGADVRFLSNNAIFRNPSDTFDVINFSVGGFFCVVGLNSLSDTGLSGVDYIDTVLPGYSGIPEIGVYSTLPVVFYPDYANQAVSFDASTTAGNTRFLVYDVDNGTLERVTVGAANSGGAGFKVLRIPN